MRPSRRSAFPASPARGGSTTTTSGAPDALEQLLDGVPDLACVEGGVGDPVQVGVLERARDRLLGDVDPPDRQRAGASVRPMLPMPQ